MTETEHGYVGDCILHLTHHFLEKECWDALVRFYAENFEHPLVTGGETGPDEMLNQKLVEFYKLEYEQRILDRFIRTGEL